MGESAEEARIQRLVQERMRTIEEEITERVSLSFEVQLAKLEDRLASQIRTNPAAGTGSMDDTTGDVEFPNGLFEPAKKRKRTVSIGQEHKEETVRRLESTLHETRQLATFLMNKVAAMESHLVALNDTQRKVKELDAIVAKHKTAMVQIRNYICEHQDFIDSLTKSLEIATGKPLEDAEAIEPYHIGVIHRLVVESNQEKANARMHREVVDKALQQMSMWGQDRQRAQALFEQGIHAQRETPSLTGATRTGSAGQISTPQSASPTAAPNLQRDQGAPPPVLLQTLPEAAMFSQHNGGRMTDDLSRQIRHTSLPGQSPVPDLGPTRFRAVRTEERSSTPNNQ